MPVDENTLHPSDEERCDGIDAAFFTGLPSEDQLQRFEWYMARWQRQAIEIRELHAEIAEAEALEALEALEENDD